MTYRIYKKAAEWCALLSLGLWLGLSYAGRLAYPEMLTINRPGWVGQVKTMQTVALIGIGIGVIGWILLTEFERRLNAQ